MRGFLLTLAFGGGLSGHLPSDHILETTDHLRTLGSLVVLSSHEIVVMGFGLVLALHLMNKFVLDLIGRLSGCVAT